MEKLPVVAHGAIWALCDGLLTETLSMLEFLCQVQCL